MANRIASAIANLTFLLAAMATPAADGQLASGTSSEPAEISLDQLAKMEIPVVEAASKYRQKVTEAPSSVTIITSDEVKAYGYRTLADLLGSAPGLYTTYDRNYSYLGVRGFSLGDFYTRNSRVLVLVDGHRINNSLTDGAAIGTDFILDTDLIDRVEVIKGPGSSLYGNNAFLGVINVITRKGRDMAGNGLEASGEAGSFDTYKGRLSYGSRFSNGLELLLSGTIYDSAGQGSLYYPAFDPQVNPGNYLARNNGIAENADGDNFKSGFGSLSFHDLSLEGGYITRQKHNPTSQFLTDFNDSRLRTTDNRGYADLKYTHEFPGVAEVTARVYYDRLDFNIVEPFTDQGGILYEDQQTGEWWGAEAQLTKRMWERLTLTLGGEYRDDFHQEEDFLNAETGVPTQPAIEQSRQSYGVYLEGDFAVLTNLHLNAGVRYDQVGDFDPAFNPRVAAIYNPLGEAVFKAIYGTAFRAPNFFEIAGSRGGSPLNPESIATYELVYEQGIGNHLRSSVSGFYNRIHDLIAHDPSTGRYQNVSGAEAAGAEMSLEAFWAGGIRGRASYAFAQTKDSNTGQVLIDSPQHVAKLNVSVPLWKDKLFAGLEFQYLSSRRTAFLDFTPQGWVLETGPDAKSCGIVNFTLFSQNLVKGLDLSASIYNLLDTAHSDPSTPYHAQSSIDQDGRTFRVKLTYRF
jgi:outer membrane receptor for ferrienterochelin and colicins